MEKENLRPSGEKRRSVNGFPSAKRRAISGRIQTPKGSRICVPPLDKSLFAEYGVAMPPGKDSLETDKHEEEEKENTLRAVLVSPNVDSSPDSAIGSPGQGASQSTETESSPDGKPVGFSNIGNSCFINAVVRALLSLKRVREEICRPLAKGSAEESLERNLCRVYEYTEQKCEKGFDLGHAIRGIWRCSSLEQYRQHDAHEFLLALFDKLPFADQLFGIPLQLQVECTHCKQLRVRYDRTLDLSASPKCGENEISKLSDCLRQSFGPEVVSDLPCEDCHQNCEAIVHRRIMALPRLLVMCLMRFDYQQEKPSTTPVKLNDSVAIPAKIDLEPFCLRPAMPAQYGLRAIVSHYGFSVEYGHYICDALASCIPKECGEGSDGPTEQWFSFNDLDVEPKELSRILQQRERTAYLLFYQRIEN